MKTNYIPALQYPVEELSTLRELAALFEVWYDRFAQENSPAQPEMSQDDLNWDGFFPYYFNQPIRLLFVGHEGRELAGCNYVESQCRSYQHGDNGFQNLNTSGFNRRQIKTAYGLIHGLSDWDRIPMASEIAPSIGLKAGISFAIMNLSKISNESDSPDANWAMIRAACQHSSSERNLIEEQVALLRPHVVIAMNFDQLSGIDVGGLGTASWDRAATNDDVGVAYLKSGGHDSLLLHTHHFAARNKSDEQAFWLPISEAIHNYRTNRSLK